MILWLDSPKVCHVPRHIITVSFSRRMHGLLYDATPRLSEKRG